MGSTAVRAARASLREQFGRTLHIPAGTTRTA
ncbi:unnamed protein product [Staurois parvus]|uniref:Uncharacterized protein n=1 Tax=Staurois parvus TaxID=386267 RepID=A0ABN9BVM2_9NEOB|nr:unnamed protein product [Staurois parvus]